MTAYTATLPGISRNPEGFGMAELAALPDDLARPFNSNDPQARNSARALWAAQALVTFINRVGEDEMENNISDLLGDLMHLADAVGVDFNEALARAESNYEAEIGGEL